MPRRCWIVSIRRWRSASPPDAGQRCRHQRAAGLESVAGAWVQPPGRRPLIRAPKALALRGIRRQTGRQWEHLAVCVGAGCVAAAIAAESIAR
ncbi:hypothetical protein PJP10_14030 [Mycobacterium kansasii]